MQSTKARLTFHSSPLLIPKQFKKGLEWWSVANAEDGDAWSIRIVFTSDVQDDMTVSVEIAFLVPEKANYLLKSGTVFEVGRELQKDISVEVL